MVTISEIRKSIIEGDTSKAVEVTKAALAAGMPAKGILYEGLIPGIAEVGELFGSGQYFLPELLVSAEAMKAAVEQVRPMLSESDAPHAGKYLIGTVQGDVHDVGKNIVIMMLEGNGWEVIDLGVDVSPEQFCTAVKEGDFDILGLAALLTLTMEKQAETIKALQVAGLRNKVKIMIGGAPVTQAYADEIGADAYGADAAEAVKKATILVGRS